VLSDGEQRCDVAPEKAAGAETVDQHHRRAAVSIALDVNGAWPDGNAEEIGVDGKETRVEGRRTEIGVPNRR